MAAIDVHALLVELLLTLDVPQAALNEVVHACSWGQSPAIHEGDSPRDEGDSPRDEGDSPRDEGDVPVTRGTVPCDQAGGLSPYCVVCSAATSSWKRFSLRRTMSAKPSGSMNGLGVAPASCR